MAVRPQNLIGDSDWTLGLAVSPDVHVFGPRGTVCALDAPTQTLRVYAAAGAAGAGAADPPALAHTVPCAGVAGVRVGVDRETHLVTVAALLAGAPAAAPVAAPLPATVIASAAPAHEVVLFTELPPAGVPGSAEDELYALPADAALMLRTQFAVKAAAALVLALRRTGNAGARLFVPPAITAAGNTWVQLRNETWGEGAAAAAGHKPAPKPVAK